MKYLHGKSLRDFYAETCLENITSQHTDFEELFSRFSGQEDMWKSETFRLKYTGMTIDLEPNVRMRYENNGDFSNSFLWDTKQRNEADGGTERILGETERIFEGGITYVSIKVPSDEVLRDAYPNKDAGFRYAIKLFIGGHEDVHAAIGSGNLTKVYELIRQHFNGCEIKTDLNRIKQRDAGQRNALSSGKGLVLCIPQEIEEKACNTGGYIALNRKNVPADLIEEVILDLILHGKHMPVGLNPETFKLYRHWDKTLQSRTPFNNNM